MIPLLTPFIARLLGDRFKPLATFLSWLVIVLVVIAAWQIWLHMHDRSVIQRHEAEVAADVTKATGEARSGADTALGKAQGQFEAKQEADRKEIDNAKAENRSPLDALFD